MSQQKYQVVLNTLITQIFTQKLKSGAKLPPERELARQMDVDRTTLRVALKQLEAMQVLHIRQGDGIYVRNFRKYAGFDFLRFLFLHQEENVDEAIIDEYIVDEVWEFWTEFVPLMIRMALEHATPSEIRSLLLMSEEALERLPDREKLVEFQLLSQDAIAASTRNLIFILISNSARPLRKKIATLYVESVDETALREQVEMMVAILRNILAGKLTEPATIADAYKRIMIRQRAIFKERWQVSARDAEMLESLIGPDDDTTARAG